MKRSLADARLQLHDQLVLLGQLHVSVAQGGKVPNDTGQHLPYVCQPRPGPLVVARHHPRSHHRRQVPVVIPICQRLRLFCEIVRIADE